MFKPLYDIRIKGENYCGVTLYLHKVHFAYLSVIRRIFKIVMLSFVIPPMDTKSNDKGALPTNSLLQQIYRNIALLVDY